MPTTDGTLAVPLLAGLDAMGCSYAVLHNVQFVHSTDPCSDIDLIIDRDPRFVLEELSALVESDGLHLAMVWEYDAPSLGTFWLTNDGQGGVQFDLMYDPSGRGRYGLRTDRALANHRRHEEWPPRLDEMASALYQLSKRISKADHIRALALLATFEVVSREKATSLINNLFCKRQARLVKRAMFDKSFPTGAAARRSSARRRLRLGVVRRFLVPSGFIIAVTGQPRAIACAADSVSKVIPYVNVVNVGGALNWLRVNALIRRPQLILVHRPPDDAHGAVNFVGNLSIDCAMLREYLSSAVEARLISGRGSRRDQTASSARWIR